MGLAVAGSLPALNEKLGDIPADAFRKHLHDVADWIADYRENIAKMRISPNVRRDGS